MRQMRTGNETHREITSVGVKSFGLEYTQPTALDWHYRDQRR